MKKRFLSLALSLSMGIFLLAGCGGEARGGNDSSKAEENVEESEDKNEAGQNASSGDAEEKEEAESTGFVHDGNLNPPGEVGEGKEPICKEKVSLVIGVPQQGNVEDWETNKQTLWLEKVGNFDLTFQVYPMEEYATQINLAVTAGGKDLPDILLNVGGDSDIAAWGEAGAVIPLNEYYENSAYYLREALDRTGVNFYPQITSPDGNMYYVPYFNQSLTNEYPAKMWIYEPWLEKLDLEKPTTPEELREVLRAFTQNDLNGNGKKDEIGLISQNSGSFLWFQALMAPFQYLGGTSNVNAWIDACGGTLNAAYTTDAYREGMKYIRSLFDEGLIDPLSFTNDINQTRALLTQEDTVVGMYVMASMSDIPATDVRRAEYVGLAPLFGADGTQQTAYSPSVPIPAGIITSNCENPEAAFRLLDYLVSEEMSIWTRWGEKGVDWVVPEEGEKSMFDSMGYPAVIKDVLPWGTLQNAHWYQTGPYIRQYSIALGLAWDGNEMNTSYLISTIQDEYTDKHPKEVLGKLIYTNEESETVSPILSSISTYVTESIANFCTNNDGMDINDDAAWEKYLQQLEVIGLSEAMEIMQTVYDRMYK